jgi:RNA polymerase sigma factor (sigma-70 family)
VRDDEAPDPFAALPQIIERLRPALARLLRRQRIPAWDAEDLVQKALTAAVRRWPTISDKQGWLYGTVRRLCIVYWRERQKDRLVATDPRLLDLREGVVIARQDRRDLLVDLDVLCPELPSRQRWVVFLRYGLGMGFAEAAGELGICVSTVWRDERQALERLRKLVAGADRRTQGELLKCGG